MRTVFALAAALSLCACASSKGPEANLCESPRPQVCTMEYNPSCGQLIAGGQRDYSSPCNACADDQVASWTQGACPDAE